MERAAPIEGFPRCDVVDGDWSGGGWSGGEGPLDLMSGAALVGALAYVERELHAIVGGWARDSGDAATVVLDAVAQHHAWRSEVLVARLPHLRELPRSMLVTSPGPATDDLLTALRGLDADDDRRAAWSAVAAALVDASDDHLSRCTPVADAPLLRWLPLLVDSLRADLAVVGAGDGSTGGTELVELVAGTERFTR